LQQGIFKGFMLFLLSGERIQISKTTFRLASGHICD